VLTNADRYNPIGAAVDASTCKPADKPPPSEPTVFIWPEYAMESVRSVFRGRVTDESERTILVE